MPKEIRPSHSSGNHRATPMLLPSDYTTTHTRPSSTWSSDDDEILMAARAQGLNWQPIASKHFPNKTANACRKRHERLMERRNAEDWDGVKLETLAKEYIAVRQEMWTLLANRVGEKWQMIEAKCMEKGLKNIQAAYRSALRKERGMDEGDSGIGCSDAENELDDSSPYAESSRVAAARGQHHHHQHQHQQQRQQIHHQPQQQHAYHNPIAHGYQLPSQDPQVQGRAGLSIQAMLSPSPPHLR